MSDGQLLTPEDVAGILQLSLTTIYNYLNQGTMPGFKIGPRVWRIPPDEFYDWLRSNPGLARQQRSPNSGPTDQNRASGSDQHP